MGSVKYFGLFVLILSMAACNSGGDSSPAVGPQGNPGDPDPAPYFSYDEMEKDFITPIYSTTTLGCAGSIQEAQQGASYKKFNVNFDCVASAEVSGSSNYGNYSYSVPKNTINMISAESLTKLIYDLKSKKIKIEKFSKLNPDLNLSQKDVMASMNYSVASKLTEFEQVKIEWKLFDETRNELIKKGVCLTSEDVRGSTEKQYPCEFSTIEKWFANLDDIRFLEERARAAMSNFVKAIGVFGADKKKVESQLVTVSNSPFELGIFGKTDLFLKKLNEGLSKAHNIPVTFVPNSTYSPVSSFAAQIKQQALDIDAFLKELNAQVKLDNIYSVEIRLNSWGDKTHALAEKWYVKEIGKISERAPKLDTPNSNYQSNGIYKFVPQVSIQVQDGKNLLSMLQGVLSSSTLSASLAAAKKINDRMSALNVSVGSKPYTYANHAVAIDSYYANAIMKELALLMDSEYFSPSSEKNVRNRVLIFHYEQPTTVCLDQNIYLKHSTTENNLEFNTRAIAECLK